MIRITAAVAALILLLAACGSVDGKATAGAPTASQDPELTDLPGVGGAPTTTVTQEALPLPGGCDLLSKETLRKTLAITTAGKPDADKDNVQCSYLDQASRRTLVITAYDLDQSYGPPDHLIDQLFAESGTKELLPGVGTTAKIIVNGTRADALALQQVGTHYRIVLMNAADSGGHVPRWREVMTTLEREALVSMVK